MHNTKINGKTIIFLCSLILLTVFIVAGCAPQVVQTEIPATATLTATPTVEPTLTPTPEITSPPVSNGLRPENAATQVYEDGTWVVKNAEGLVTATWNEGTSAWEYNLDNIKVEYTQIGLKVDQAVIEPFLGPLPPDDPSTHFINPATGERVDYGVGPESAIYGTGGSVWPVTEIFARFRGITDEKIPGSRYLHAIVFEIPMSADRSAIFVAGADMDNFSLFGTPDDSYLYDQYTHIYTEPYIGDSAKDRANANYIGQMMMILARHNDGDLMDTRLTRSLVNFLSGSASTMTGYTMLDPVQTFGPMYMLPESVYMKPLVP